MSEDTSEIDGYLRNTLQHLRAIYGEMESATGDVLFVSDGDNFHFRHAVKSDALVCYLKGIKSISTLNACLVLLEHGYIQEIGALCRMVDDYCNEIFFLRVPPDGIEFTKDQIKFVETFFQEEFDQPTNPFASTQKRATVPVRKVHATFAKIAEEELNPSDTQEILRKTQQVLSGYVHGAYPHIMEMYGGNPPSYHVTGMLGTPRIPEWRNQIIGYVYRLLMASVFISRKLGVDSMERPLRELLSEFEDATGSKPKANAETMLNNLKKGGKQ